MSLQIQRSTRDVGLTEGTDLWTMTFIGPLILRPTEPWVNERQGYPLWNFLRIDLWSRVDAFYDLGRQS